MRLTKQKARKIAIDWFVRSLEKWMRWNWGERCADYHRRCDLCNVWRLFDKAKLAIDDLRKFQEG